MSTWGLSTVGVRFGTVIALEDVTVPVEPGTVTVVLGGDGAGKTTALRTLVGLCRHEGGQVRRPAKDRIGYVPATGGIYPDLSVAENVVFAARCFGIGVSDRPHVSVAMLERLGLASFADRLAGHLSGGMQRKLAVGMALMHQPELLVLDEPTTGVDPVSRAELWRLLSRAAAQGAGALISTTYLAEAMRANHVTVLEAGRQLLSGSPDQILSSVPGLLGQVQGSLRPSRWAWRRGAQWRVWAPTGSLPEGASAVVPDIDDAVVVAALAAEQVP